MFDSVGSYYKFHSKIYDFTRWSILFGRNSIFDHLPGISRDNINILDLGCGTGKSLIKLAEHFPKANITGLDASKEMIAKALPKIRMNNRIEIIQSSYQSFLPKKEHYDLIFCSYSLSMFGSSHEFSSKIHDSLKKNGCIVVVDFDNTPLQFFERWMNFNHVEISGSLFKNLKKLFRNKSFIAKKGYFGLWNYSFFVGTK